MEKPKKTTKNKKFRPMSPARPLPRPCPWVWTFLFCFLEVLAKLQKTMEKQKKTKSSDPCPLPGLSPDPVHGSELFFFFFVFWFFHGFFACFSCEDAFITVPLKKCAFLQFAHLRPPGQTAKKTWKNQKNQKVQTHVPCQASPQTLSMGLFFFVFSRFCPNYKKPWKKQKQK